MSTSCAILPSTSRWRAQSPSPLIAPSEPSLPSATAICGETRASVGWLSIGELNR
ncbi:Uncharacterised protein [Mycobacteroides abscessus subsp. abscessus]|nr:Uncharacterised protein [Mycobacteroides abscessus subsp. abscessus]